MKSIIHLFLPPCMFLLPPSLHYHTTMSIIRLVFHPLKSLLTSVHSHPKKSISHLVFHPCTFDEILLLYFSRHKKIKNFHPHHPLLSSSLYISVHLFPNKPTIHLVFHSSKFLLTSSVHSHTIQSVFHPKDIHISKSTQNSLFHLVTKKSKSHLISHH